MKRLFSLLLALCMVLTLTGCITKTDKADGGLVKKLYEGSTDAEFAALALDIDVADITIQPGDAFRVEYGLCHEPEIGEDGGTLTICEKAESRWWQNVSFGSIGQPYVRVTVPAGTALESLSVLLDVGSVKLQSVDAGVLDLHADVGDLKAEDVAVTGAITLRADVGDIDCERLVSGVSISAQTDTGGVELEDCDAPEISAESDVGNVELELGGTAQDWSMTLECDTGGVKVDGANQGNRHETAGGAKTLTARTDVGNVEVEFKG